jgi:hypothetical protein
MAVSLLGSKIIRLIYYSISKGFGKVNVKQEIQSAGISVPISAPIHPAGIANIAAQLVTLFGTHVAPGVAALAALIAPLLALVG